MNNDGAARAFHVELCLLIGSGAVNRDIEKLKAICDFAKFIIATLERVLNGRRTYRLYVEFKRIFSRRGHFLKCTDDTLFERMQRQLLPTRNSAIKRRHTFQIAASCVMCAIQ